MKNILTDYSQSNYITGRVSVNHKTCTGCHQCALICPASALEINGNKKSQMKEGTDCISCGDCIAVCHTDSITIKNFYHIPDGVYQTVGRIQPTGKKTFPRYFSEKPSKKDKGD